MGLHHESSECGQTASRRAGAARVAERRHADGTRELLLVKAGQRYGFTCAAGEESRLLERLRELAGDSDSGIDWFDAALLSHQLGAHLAARIRAVAETRPDNRPDDAPPSQSLPNPPSP